MSEQFHSYLMSLIGMGLICSLALVLTPAGRAKKAVTLACAAAMLCAVLRPLAGLDPKAFSECFTGYRLEAEKYAAEGKENAENLNRMYIEDKLGAYILDKADEYGADIKNVKVELNWSNNGFWYPVSVRIEGEAEEKARQKLESYIETELGICASVQEWSNE